MNSAAEYKVVVPDSDCDAREILVHASGLSAARVSQAMTSGAVWLKNKHGIKRIRRRSTKLAQGDELFLNYDEAVLAQTVADARLLRDGGRWSVWDKPAGMRAQGSRWGDHTTLGRFAEHRLEPMRESFIVHRLDMAAHGLMMLAHDKKAAASLSRQFAERTVDKQYHAVVHGKFPRTSNTQVYSDDIGGKSALTTAQRTTFYPESNRSLVQVSIASGRKHQIRKHLSAAGFPIVGDRLYGGGDETDLCLCASLLGFDDPQSGERVEIERPPTDWL